MNTNLPSWSPSRELQTFRTLFDTTFGMPSIWSWPVSNGQELNNLPLDIYDEGDNLVVEAMVPGVQPDDVDVSLQDDVLSIKAETKRSTETKQSDYYLAERRYGMLHRTLRLPADLDSDRAAASFKNGIMKITIPRKPQSKSKRIKIKAS